MLKQVMQLKLKMLAKLILKKYQPQVIGITGSVGKTSAKDAIYSLLSQKFSARKNINNYNNEIGVPLTIIGFTSPGKSIFGWMSLFVRAGKLLVTQDENYPKILVLELAVDHPGDMDYLLDIIKPWIGVLTFIGPVHLENFNSLEDILEEKAKLIADLSSDECAILNFDNELVKQAAKKTKSEIISYGFNSDCQLRAKEVNFIFGDRIEGDKLTGISYKLSYKNTTIPIYLPGVLGSPAVYASLAAAAIGLKYGMNLVEISQALKNFKAPTGRLNIIKGVKNTTIIDDTYNSSPQSCAVALEIASKIELPTGARKYAVLGDMLELGSISEKSHLDIGKLVQKYKFDKLIVVGERSRDIARGAEKAGLGKDNIFHFNFSPEAGKFLQEQINESDLALVKGSQGIRMEKIVKEIMSEPLLASELLVRQDQAWLNK